MNKCHRYRWHFFLLLISRNNTYGLYMTCFQQLQKNSYLKTDTYRHSKILWHHAPFFEIHHHSSRIVGGRATPTARNTFPQVPMASLRTASDRPSSVILIS